MSNKEILDYKPLKPSALAGQVTATSETQDVEQPVSDSGVQEVRRRPKVKKEKDAIWIARHGHYFSFLGLFLFTTILYFRPYELIPALASFHSMAYWIAILTLLVFIPSQVLVEGSWTARPPELNYLFLFCLTAILSMPLAINRWEAWDVFNNYLLKTTIIFIIIINVVRTEKRLRALFFLTISVSCMLSIAALNDYRLGYFRENETEARIGGLIGGIFANPNDLALHLSTITPICLAMFLNSKGLLRRFVYGSCALLMVAANIVTFSRGGFLALIASAVVFAWKIGRRQRFFTVLGLFWALVFTLLLSPGSYGTRLLSIFNSSLDLTGSSTQRQLLLKRAVSTAIHNPAFGVGIGNFHHVSLNELVAHNSYAEVAAEMGFLALLFYLLFMIVPFKRLGKIEDKTFGIKADRKYYNFAVGLQAALVAYMVGSFFGSVQYQWYIYYLVGYAVVMRRLFENRNKIEIKRKPLEI